ncbi:GNAT family N-acetyltransferase [Alkalihalobacterium sp. APHAB7]|uniref:GNAT family N-acetyltransferase n=1 Tax=Alkalihalobacterium sp. APHAB7 TaxID=3402081 RepID=UPI003AADA0F0
MDYIRITSIEDPLFKKMHNLMQEVFPPEEVLEFELWEEPLKDPDIRVFVAVNEDEVVGATEYRYYVDWNIAMTDFTIIGQDGRGIGPFLANHRLKDLKQLANENGKELYGMFAEIYNPNVVDHSSTLKVKSMDPLVRREVLSHLGYQQLDFNYVHPSWKNDGEAVSGLDLGFMPFNEDSTEVEANLVVNFLTTYYAVLSNKPQEWLTMIEVLKGRGTIKLLPL